MAASLGVVSETIAHYLGRIVVTAVAAIAIYAGAKIAIKVVKAFQELFFIWTVTFGKRWTPDVQQSKRIQPFFCRTSELDEVAIQECFRFHSEAFYAGEDIPQNKVLALYRDVLLSYSHILFCRHRLDGSLRGVVLLGLEHKPTYTVLKIGMMLAHQNYRGGPWMRLASVYLMLKELILHPRTPLFMIGKLSTYKPYLVATTLPETYPRYDREAPEQFKKIAEEFVKGSELPTDSYDRDTFVLKRRVGIVRCELAEISERTMSNPHVRFFNKHNPGWREGDQLVAVAKVTWGIWLKVIGISLRQFRSSSGTASAGSSSNRKTAQIMKTRLKRGLSYQDGEATLQLMRIRSSSFWDDYNEGVANGQVHADGVGSGRIDRLFSCSEEELDVELNL